MRNLIGTAAGLSAAMLLAACGGEGAGGNAGGATASTGTAASSSAAGGQMPADFKATDACAVFDKAVVAKVLGTSVTEASLGLVHEANGNEAATSECTYTLADGRATIMTRWSPIGDNSEGAINEARNTLNQVMKAFGAGPAEDVAGLGKASIWAGKAGQLQTFIGEDRMVLITVPDGPDAKDKAIALAKKAGA